MVHYYGDCFLQDYARMLKDDFPQIKVFRFGGDEFMLLDDNCDSSHGNDTLSRLFKSTNRAFKYEDFSYYPSISVGVVKYPDDGHDRQMIFKNIDLALYQAKNKGKNQAVKFHLEIQNEIERKMHIEKRNPDDASWRGFHFPLSAHLRFQNQRNNRGGIAVALGQEHP